MRSAHAEYVVTTENPPMTGASDRPARWLRGGVAGNERLTALAGTCLFLLLAAEGFTILNVHALVVAHVVIGMVVTAVVGLKLVSTGWRFTRYYSGDRRFREAGPPHPFMRVLAPVLVLLTGAVLGTGIMLILVGRDSGPWLFLHKATFVLWLAVTSLHVLAYLWRVPRLVGQDLLPRIGAALPGRWLRLTSVVVALAVGAGLAAFTAHSARPWSDGSDRAAHHHRGDDRG
jgi:hypothetical protein